MTARQAFAAGTAALAAVASMTGMAHAAASEARYISISGAPQVAPPEYPVLLHVQVQTLDSRPAAGANITLTTTGTGIFQEAPQSATLQKVADDAGMVSVYVRNTKPDGGGTQTVTASLSPAETSCEIPTARPGGCSDSTSVSWSVHKAFANVLRQTVIGVGHDAAGVVTGSAGLHANLFASGPTDVGYVQVRDGAITASGFSYAVHPRVNTLLKATANDFKTPPVLLQVRPALSLRGVVKGSSVRFSGGFVPGRSGVTVKVYRVVNGALSGTPVATAVTGADGMWSVTRTFATNGLQRFIAISTADQFNVAGQSNRVGLQLG